MKERPDTTCWICHADYYLFSFWLSSPYSSLKSLLIAPMGRAECVFLIVMVIPSFGWIGSFDGCFIYQFYLFVAAVIFWEEVWVLPNLQYVSSIHKSSGADFLFLIGIKDMAINCVSLLAVRTCRCMPNSPGRDSHIENLTYFIIIIL